MVLIVISCTQKTYEIYKLNKTLKLDLASLDVALELRSKYQINVFAIALGGEISRLKELTGAANRVLTGQYFFDKYRCIF